MLLTQGYSSFSSRLGVKAELHPHTSNILEKKRPGSHQGTQENKEMNRGNNNNDDYDDKTSESCPPFHRRIPLFFRRSP